MIKYKTGDLFTQFETNPTPIKIITHCCNDLGICGSGFVVPLFNKFPKAKQDYQEYVDSMKSAPIEDNLLGDVIYSKIPPKLIIANMIGQKGIGREKRVDKPIRYWAIVKCMESVRKTAKTISEKGANIEIHAPKFGSERAGGKWEIIEELINEIWFDYPVTIYTL